jgi:hypothetical protein
MKIKTIKNIPHDLLPIIRDISDQLILLRTVKSASDHIKLLNVAKDNVFLIEKYLLELDKEAQKKIVLKNLR